MKEQITPQYNFQAKEIDAELNMLQFELEAIAQVQAKHDAQQRSLLTEAMYEIRLLQTIIAPKVQAAINVIREKLLVAAQVVGIQQMEIAARKKVEKARRDINEKELAVIEACKQREDHYVPLRKASLKNILNISGFVIAVIDSVIAYGNFRTGSYSTVQATAMALSVFSLIYFTTNLITPWIKAAKTKASENLRAFTVCAIVFFCFLGIGMLRTEGLNSVISVTVDASNELKVNHSPVPILLVSYGLFLCMFFIHQFYWQSEEQKNKEEQERLQYQNVAQLRAEILALIKEIKQIEKDLLERKDEVRQLYDYYNKLVLKAENIGVVAAGIYKRTFSLYSSTIPEFFQRQQQITYDKEINFFNLTK